MGGAADFFVSYASADGRLAAIRAHRGEQERLVAVAGKKVVGHGRSYAISLLCCLF
jgi:hypothetical protein